VTDWFTLRMQLHRDIHTAFAIRASYTDSAVVEPVDLAVRWHSRFGLPVGDIAGGDYAGVLETIDRLYFSAAELAEKGIRLRRSGQVFLKDYQYTFTLDVKEPNAGIVVEIWTVAN
jgi:hypothetical protein